MSEMSKYLVGVDAGHGGRDPGAIGPSGLYEKDVTLAVSLALVNSLKSAGLSTYLTRDKDVFTPLDTRSKALNDAKCNLAISVHCNSHWNTSAKYVSTFIQAQGGEAEKLAEKVQAELVRVTGWPNGGVRIQNLHMTRETRMPAVLVELGFISNPDQEKQLRDPEVQKKIAGAIANGVLAHLGIERKEEGVMQDVKDAKDVKVIVKGNEIDGKLVEGTTWVPLRAVIDALANEVLWDEKERTAIVR